MNMNMNIVSSTLLYPIYHCVPSINHSIYLLYLTHQSSCLQVDLDLYEYIKEITINQ